MLKTDKRLVAELESAISGKEKITIVSHSHPDGDALGSSLGLFRYLHSRGKNPTVIYPDKYPESLEFMIKNEEKDSILIHDQAPEIADKAVEEADIVICVDFNTFSRTEGVAEALRRSAAFKILIDHHLFPDRDSFQLVFSQPEISSTCELLFHILLGMSDIEGEARKLPLGTGEALMTGMTTDTNNFANSVYPSTLMMASALLEAGVDRNAIVEQLYNHYREARFRLLGHILDKKLTIMDNGVAYIIIDKALAEKFGIREGETEGFVNIPLGIDRVKMSVLAKEDEGRFRISIRSKIGISANKFAGRFFNGGGHEQASGGKLIFGTDIANDALALEKYIRESAETYMSES